MVEAAWRRGNHLVRVGRKMDVTKDTAILEGNLLEYTWHCDGGSAICRTASVNITARATMQWFASCVRMTQTNPSQMRICGKDLKIAVHRFSKYNFSLSDWTLAVLQGWMGKDISLYLSKAGGDKPQKTCSCNYRWLYKILTQECWIQMHATLQFGITKHFFRATCQFPSTSKDVTSNPMQYVEVRGC